MKLYGFLAEVLAEVGHLLASGWGLAFAVVISAWLLVVTMRWALDGVAEVNRNRNPVARAIWLRNASRGRGRLSRHEEAR